MVLCVTRAALLTWLTVVPPDRVGVARKLQLGVTLKPTVTKPHSFNLQDPCGTVSDYKWKGNLVITLYSRLPSYCASYHAICRPASTC